MKLMYKKVNPGDKTSHLISKYFGTVWYSETEEKKQIFF
jgi:hypothetical protein